MIVLIDGDIVSYRCSASAENEPDWIATTRCDNLINTIISETKADDCVVYISGESNFRKELSSEYKANRTQPKPKWLEFCREHLVSVWGAKLSHNMEADDAIVIHATDDPDNYIIASLDKDFKQVPGWHYQWAFQGTSHGKQWFKEAQYFHVTPLEGLKFFYKQLLIGDEADNIKGVFGIGKVKANKLIDPCTTELEMFNVVRPLYNDDERLLLNGRLLWILRKEDQVWQFPKEENEQNQSTEVS